MNYNFLISFLTILFATTASQAQVQEKSKDPIFSFKNGLGITSPDSNFSINIRFRIQNRFLMNTKSFNDLSTDSWEARVRRARLSFTGFIFDPRFTYHLQLSFSRGDLDWNGPENSTQNTSPNVLRDAMVFYRPNQNWQFGFGQGKLPGNRQRVVSSGSLQFFDRSPVNAAFTLDRDFGFFINYMTKLSPNFTVLCKTALTSGEGRNSIGSNSGLAYTGRVELLPLGDFLQGGDYFEGDVAREPTPKVSLAAGMHYNDMAVRTQGQLGRDLYAPRSFNAFMADFLFKFKGIALSSEYLQKNAISTAITTNSEGNIRDLLVGKGINTQLSYCFPSLWEIAARHSLVVPDAEIEERTNQVTEFGLGVTKYIMKHKTKAQFNIFARNNKNLVTETEDKFFYIVFQLEAGI